MNIKYMYLIALMQNVVSIGCWMALAIIFDKWWLMFFALLFFTNVKNKNGHRRICDGCGEYCDSVGETPDDATKEAAKLGWYQTIDETGKVIDYCPDCRKKHGV